MNAHRSHSQAGFTVVELVISMLILGIIVLPLASSYVLGIGTTAQSNATTNDSSDSMNVASFFTNDVASAYRVSTANTCGGGNNVVQFELGQSGSGANPFYVAYGAAEDTAAEVSQHISPIFVLTRYACDSGGTITTSTEVASQMTGVPTLACVGMSVSNCDGTSRTPTLVSLTVTEYGQTQSDTQYTFTVSGTRRVTA